MGHRAPLQARPVDMGLPSGVQWANCNVGAERPVDLGLFFSWGNIEGHMVGEGYDFSQDVYNSTPGANIATDLSLEQDAARAYLGEPWRMPTAAEFQELYDNCTVIWASMNDVDGLLFTSNVNGNTLFFPAAGQYSGASLLYRGTRGYYWSSSFVSAASAHDLDFSSVATNPQSTFGRRFGFSVRAVIQL